MHAAFLTDIPSGPRGAEAPIHFAWLKQDDGAEPTCAMRKPLGTPNPCSLPLLIRSNPHIHTGTLPHSVGNDSRPAQQHRQQGRHV